MLKRLYIKNFALIEEISVEFSDKFNVLTGETGAGKSIIIDAVSLLLGGRAQTELIRFGKDRSLLEGVFELPGNHSVFQLLEELGIGYDEQTIILTREISIDGKNSSRVNGRTLTLGQYRQVGLQIVDIHGQHDHQSLLQVEHHINILDKFGEQEHILLTNRVRESFKGWQHIKNELDTLKTKEQERLQRIDFLSYQLSEIGQAKLEENEDEELKREAALLGNAEKISSHMQKAYTYLFGAERGLSAYELVAKALGSIAEVKNIDPELEKLYGQLEPSLYILEETAAEARNYLENIEFSPHKLEQVEKRLHLIKDLNKKYGATIKGILDYEKKAQSELEYWEKSIELTEKLEKDMSQAWNKYTDLALQLSHNRKSIAGLLESRVKTELAELAMPDTKFVIQFTAAEASGRGLEKIEFLISPNPGEPLLPVVKIASGGELSRIMLAIKAIIADKDEIGTLIFDEIDSGIGGKAAQKLAEKLNKISNSQQVICVTHSPLVAALANFHMLLHKKMEGERTITTVYHLQDNERVDEIVRMLGGEKQTENLRNYAAQLLKG